MSSSKLNPNFQATDNRQPSWFYLLAVIAAVGMLEGCSFLPVEGERGTRDPKEILSTRKSPGSNDALTRGTRYYDQGYFLSASVELNNVPENHPQYPKALSLLEKTHRILSEVAHYEKSAVDHKTRGEFPEALHQIEHALNLYPKNKRLRKFRDKLGREIRTRAKISFNRGVALYGEGKLDEAMVHFQRAHRLSPTNPVMADQLVTAYNSRALKYYREGDLEQAIRDLKHSLTVNPEQEAIRTQLQEMENRLGLLNKISP